MISTATAQAKPPRIKSRLVGALVLTLITSMAHAQQGAMIAKVPIPAGDIAVVDPVAGSPYLVDGGKPPSGGSGVSSFNGRTGAVLPQAGDYGAFYAPLGPPVFLSGSAPVTASQLLACNPQVVTTAGVTLTYPATAGATGCSAIMTEGGSVVVQPNAADAVCMNGACGAPGAPAPLAQGQVFFVFADGKGHLYVGL